MLSCFLIPFQELLRPSLSIKDESDRIQDSTLLKRELGSWYELDFSDFSLSSRNPGNPRSLRNPRNPTLISGKGYLFHVLVVAMNQKTGFLPLF